MVSDHTGDGNLLVQLGIRIDQPGNEAEIVQNAVSNHLLVRFAEFRVDISRENVPEHEDMEFITAID